MMAKKRNSIYQVWRHWAGFPGWLRLLWRLGLGGSVLRRLEIFDDEFRSFAKREERVWREWCRNNLPRSEREWLEIFSPEAREIIPLKVLEWRVEERRLLREIKRKLLHLERSKPSERTRVFLWECMRAHEKQELSRIRKHIARLKHATGTLQRREGGISSLDIENAKAVPIQNIVDAELRRSGNVLKCLCPLHHEKTPSFCVYESQNRFHCFGCGRDGDTIELVRLLHNLGFVEAVRHLLSHAYLVEPKGRKN